MNYRVILGLVCLAVFLYVPRSVMVSYAQSGQQPTNCGSACDPEYYRAMASCSSVALPDARSACERSAADSKAFCYRTCDKGRKVDAPEDGVRSGGQGRK